MDIQKILEVAPQLHEVRACAVETLKRGGPGFWNRYEAVKSRLNRIVGFDCQYDYPGWMFSTEAHDAAYRFVFRGLV